MTLTRNELKDIKTLLTKKGRRTKKMFLSEGVRLLEEAVRHDFMPVRVVFSDSRLSERGRELLTAFKKRGVAVDAVKEKDIEYISGAQTSQGIVGVFQTPATDFSEQFRSEFRRLLWCYGINDPGNLGTLIRSALAFGFDMMVTSGNSAEFFAPKVIRSSAGSIFGLPVAVADEDRVLRNLTENGIKLVATDLKTDKSAADAKALIGNSKLTLAIGSEAEGLPDSVIERADVLVKLKHADKVESLNAGVAGSILMSMIYNRQEEL